MSQLKQNGISKNKGKKNKSKEKVKVFTKRKPNLKDAEANIIEKLQARYETIDSSSITKFGDFPLSQKTLKGLRECGYHKPTEIQKETIGLALQGKDILGAAQTGSGKTLAFLIPVIEKLYCKQWTKLDGVGALVITPTRELAYQIFETLRRVGEHHDFSAGLIIGGKDLKFEKNRMDQCNIIICTPGRLLQHMDQNPLFDCVNMQILVLDEADRCLDMGFEQTMNAIIANLPLKRQTLLFSATQTRSVKDLARLSLKDPSYISVHENSEFGTPKELSQSYMVCELQDKMSVLWSFLRNHSNKKIIVFFSSCKQAKYTYEIFCKLRPGISLMALYGTLHQLRRMDIYDTFCKKQSSVLFATDIAARGLDFPEVHWVVQVDCPEDVATYIHRVGRTARYHRGGESLLMLLPSEIKMAEKLEEKKIPIEKIEVNPLKLNNPVQKMEAYLTKDSTLKDTAQRAFVAYAKAVFLMKDKEVFDVQALNTDAFARSLGLTVPPRIRFLQRLNARTSGKKPTDTNNAKNKTYFNSDSEGETKNTLENKLSSNKRESDDSGQSGDDEPYKPKAFQVLDDDGCEDERFFEVEREKHDVEPPATLEVEEFDVGRNNNNKPITRAAAVKKILKNKAAPNKKIVFADDDDEAVSFSNKYKVSKLAQQYDSEGVMDTERIKLMVREEDRFDNQTFREKIKAKHKDEKRKLKEKKKKEEEEEKDEFGESESDEADLSWLPDPDKIYGEKTEEEVERLMQGSDTESEEEEEESEQETTKKPKKRKGKERLKKKQKSEEEEEEDDSEEEEVKERSKKRKGKGLKKQKSEEEEEDDSEEEVEEKPRKRKGKEKFDNQHPVLKKKQKSEEEEEDESEEEFDRLGRGSDAESEEEEEERLKVDTVKENSKKRKAKGSIVNLETVLKKKRKHKIDQISSSLSVNEAEELAMLLLRNK